MDTEKRSLGKNEFCFRNEGAIGFIRLSFSYYKYTHTNVRGELIIFASSRQSSDDVRMTLIYGKEGFRESQFRRREQQSYQSKPRCRHNN